jgi:hypothetical protein
MIGSFLPADVATRRARTDVRSREHGPEGRGSEASATCPPVTRRGSAVGDQVDLDWLDAAQQAGAACQVQSGVEGFEWQLRRIASRPIKAARMAGDGNPQMRAAALVSTSTAAKRRGFPDGTGRAAGSKI